MLPEDIKRRVVEECRRRAEPKTANIIITVIFSAVFVYAGLQAASLVRSNGETSGAGWLFLIWAVPFLSVPFILISSLFIRPKKILRMAESDDYEYYIGGLTDMYYTHTDNGHRYYLVIDNAVKYKCTSEQYRDAELGHRYILLYFHKRRPEVCFKLTGQQKEIY